MQIESQSGLFDKNILVIFENACIINYVTGIDEFSLSHTGLQKYRKNAEDVMLS